MKNIFLTGVTGFLGGELLVMLSLDKQINKIYCLVRTNSMENAYCRLEKVFNLHGDNFDRDKIVPVIGDLTKENLSQSLIANKELQNIDTVVHAAANTSFSKIYDDLVEKVNVNGLKQILGWSKTLTGLQTFAYIGTATIVGKNASNRVVHEDESPDLKAIHFVKYTYTKMIGEFLLRESLPAEKILVIRPSIIMGDSRNWIPRTYVILWAIAAMNLIRLVPLNPNCSLDIISVDYAANAIIALLKCKRNYSVYHLSSGIPSMTNFGKLAASVSPFYNNRPNFTFINNNLVGQIKLWARNKLKPGATLYDYSECLKYWEKIFPERGKIRIICGGLEPYLEFNELGQVFDNTRLLEDTGIGLSEPAHCYLSRTAKYLANIDVLEGALDP